MTVDKNTLAKIGGKIRWMDVPYTTTKLSVETGKNKWQTAGGDTMIARVDVGVEADPEAVLRATREWLKQLAVEANKETLDKLLALYNKYHGKPEAPPKEIVREIIKEAGLEGDTSEYTNIKGQPHKLCTIHNEWMPERSNDQGKWYSHKDGDDWCKGE
jgi:hypothetical protein